jgi:hypothetical protein
MADPRRSHSNRRVNILFSDLRHTMPRGYKGELTGVRLTIEGFIGIPAHEDERSVADIVAPVRNSSSSSHRLTVRTPRSWSGDPDYHFHGLCKVNAPLHHEFNFGSISPFSLCALRWYDSRCSDTTQIKEPRTQGGRFISPQRLGRSQTQRSPGLSCGRTAQIILALGP